jgi:DNA-directed RNA polymerase subunit M/transcription elongation factor TFIIS
MSGIDVSDYTIPCGASTSCRHQICQHCGEPMRIGNSRATDHPGTKTGTLQDQQCRQCRERGGPPVPTVPDRCVDCDMPFRGRSESLEDHPGTVRHEGHGQCQSCYREERREEIAAYRREVARLKRKKTFEASESEIRDERHVLLSDRELSHVAEVSPRMYWWHVQRRNRLFRESV